jgi:hypothetical protein
VLRPLTLAIAGLLAAPALALAANEGSTGGDHVTEAMFVLIIAAIALLAIVAALEARRSK